MVTIIDAIEVRGGAGTLTVLAADGTTRTATWAAVHDRARRLAEVLNRRGVGRGDRVCLLADTSVELVAAVQATWLAGAAVTMLPLPVRTADAAYRARLERLLADARPALLALGDPCRSLRPALARSFATAELKELVAEAHGGLPATRPEIRPGDLAILQYTSGSTRDPRGVPVTHGHLTANLAGIRSATRHEATHGCQLSWLPLYHDMGLVGGLALPMSCGCPLVLQSPVAFAARPIAWLEAVTSFRATVTGAPNFAWALMARLLAARPLPDPAVRLDSLRLALTGAEPVDPAAMARFVAAAAPRGLDPAVVLCGYGLAEATLAVTFSRPGAGLRTDVVDPVALESHGRAVAAPTPPGRSLARLGRPVPGTRIRIVDQTDGRVLGQRRVGRIEVAGPAVTAGYWGAPTTRPDRWLPTGDLGYLADGDLVVCGRESDVLFAAGRNVFPQDVEVVAGAVVSVRPGQAVAFGVPGPGTGDRLVVAVESASWADTSAVAALRAAVVAAVVAEVGLTPREVVVLAPGHLCRTSSGKPRRAETRRRYLAGELARPVTTELEAIR